MAVVGRRVVLAGGIGTTLSVPRIVKAQADWPKGPMKFIVPVPPGGGTDPIARFIAAKLSPTLAEQGIKSYPTYSWWGIYAPAGMPAPSLDRMNGELTKAVRSGEVMQKLVEQIYLEVLASSPAEFASFQKAEQERWFRVIRENNIKTD